jgi:hypothetical protein
MVETSFSPDGPPVDPHDSTACRDFGHLPIGHSLRPPHHGTRDTACSAMARGRGTTAKHRQERRLRASRRLGANPGPMPGTQPTCGVVAHGQRRLWGPFAHAQGDDPLTRGRPRWLSPPVPGRLTRMRRTGLLLLFTQCPWSSNSKARGGTSGTRWSWHRSAWRPAIRRKRATVSVATWTRRAVARTPPPSSQWVLRDAAWSSALWGVEQRGAAPCGARLAARPAPQEPEAGLAVDVASGESVLPRETQPLAVGVDTRESIAVGALHEVLLENSGSRSPGLQTTRRFLSICVMSTGHYLSAQRQARPKAAA